MLSTLSCLAVLFLRLGSSTTRTIPTLLGNFIGNVRTPQSEGVPSTEILEFMGVRYAQPPVGVGRFRRAEEWTTPFPSDYNATYARPACIQIPNEIHLPMAEDCLFLNIWTPAHAPGKEKLPVLFFIHGGSFIHGSGAYFLFNSTYLAMRNVTVVTINYRLGPLGFLASQDIKNSNPNWPSYGGTNGIYDQIIALRWVNTYIEAFGGNPNDVTIFGESAGGLSVCALLVTNFTKGLFRRAISESGPCIGPWAPANLTVGLELTKLAMEANGISTFGELKVMDAIDLQTKLQATFGNLWFVSVDKWLINDVPEKVFQQRTADNVPLNAKEIIWGLNTQDGLASWPYKDSFQPKSMTDLQNFLMKYLSSNTVITQLLQKFYNPSVLGGYAESWYAMNGDLCVACPALWIADTTQKAKSLTWVYSFNGTAPPYKAPHASELPYVFGWANATAYFHLKYSKLTSYMMMDAWSHFAKSGNPSFSPCFNCGRTESWLPFEVKQSVAVFADQGHIQQNFQDMYFRGGACNYWKQSTTPMQRSNLCNKSS